MPKKNLFILLSAIHCLTYGSSTPPPAKIQKQYDDVGHQNGLVRFGVLNRDLDGSRIQVSLFGNDPLPVFDKRLLNTGGYYGGGLFLRQSARIFVNAFLPPLF